MNFGLTGKRALVGGGSKGLGLAAAQALAGEGCAVAIVSRSRDHLKRAAATMPAETDILTIEADLSTAEGIHNCIGTADQWGPVDILVNNTGGPPAGRSFEQNDEAWDKAYRALLGYVRGMCEHFVPRMRERNWGRVITITSVTVKEPSETLVLSNVFRAGVTAYLKVLAKEVAADGVTVNTILPGAFRTERYEQLLENTAARTGRTKEEAAQDVIGRLPQRRFQRPEELGALVAFLASGQASAITGASIPVDGGMLHGLLT
jgi:3-oxoacyl-[acyl-carrier protein] reductase